MKRDVWTVVSPSVVTITTSPRSTHDAVVTMWRNAPSVWLAKVTLRPFSLRVPCLLLFIDGETCLDAMRRMLFDSGL